MRTLYLAWFSPYGLAEDEAFYSLWSQHPAWSYNTKGPGIAWAMFASTSVFGHSAFGVRMVAVLACAIGALATAALCRDLTASVAHKARAAFLGAAIYNLIPAAQALGLLATIDGPYLACWALAALGAWWSLTARRASGPLLLALGLGLGFLFKYTILLLLPGVLVLLLAALRRPSTSTSTSLPRPLAFLASAALFALFLAPVFIWNAQHDWATVKHLLGHLGLAPDLSRLPAPPPTPGTATPTTFPLKYTFELLGTQLATVGPLTVAAFFAWRARRQLTTLHAAAPAFCLALAAPILLFYLAVSFNSSVEGNWPLAGWLAFIPLVIALWQSAQPAGTTSANTDAATPTSPPRVSLATLAPPHGTLRFFFNAIAIYGLVAGLAMLRLDLLRAALEPSIPPLARAIPIGRLIGADAMTAHVLRLAGEHHASNPARPAPFILCQHYGRGSQLEFALRSGSVPIPPVLLAAGFTPTVYISQSRMGGRQVQHDFWPGHSLDQPALLGKDAIIIADSPDPALWRPFFDSVTPINQPDPTLDGGLRGTRFGLIGRGFKGFPPAQPNRY